MRATRARFSVAAGALAATGLLRFPAGAAEFTYKAGLNNPATAPLSKRMVEAADNILKDSNGRLEIKVFPGSQLGNDVDVLAQTRLGATEFNLVPDAVLSTVQPIANMTGIPFIVTNTKDALSLLSGPFGAYVRNTVANAGLFQFPGSWDAGFRQIQNSVRPVTTPADLKGIKLRTSPDNVEVAMFKALGALPTPLPAAEMYTSVSSHLVDGVAIVLIYVEAFKIYEVTKYISYTNHIWVGETLVANPAAWNKLPKNLQDIVSRNVEAARRGGNDDSAKLSVGAEARLKGLGMIFNNADAPAFERIIRSSGLYTQWKASYPADAWALLERATGHKLA